MTTIFKLPLYFILATLAVTDTKLSLANNGVNPRVEEVIVSARAGRSSGAGAFETIVPQDAPASPVNIAQLLLSQPGVGLSGQGGLFQTISIHGLSRQRVSQYFLDIPILTERRAGTSSSFIDPTMLGDIELLRGPASTHYGSGAMGGVVQLQPGVAKSTDLTLGWGSAGDENLQYFGTGNNVADIALSHRGANNSRSTDGLALNTGFDQYNGKLGLRHATDELEIAFDTLMSVGRDIGKSNIRYPDDRITAYPEEHHWLGQLGIDRGNQWHGSVFFHYQDLQTTVDYVGGPSTLGEGESLDLGGSAYWNTNSMTWPTRLGIDYLARRNVTAKETHRDVTDTISLKQTTLDAEQDQLGLYIDTETSLGKARVAGGLRGSYTIQDSADHSSDSDSSVSGFAQAQWLVHDTTELSLELATGVRFPSLSERYFSGVTGRGLVTGNPHLDPEQSVNLEFGLHSELPQGAVDIRLYRMEIKDFIARVAVGPETLSYLNSGDGDIAGVDLQLQRQLTERILLSIDGQYLKGEDQEGEGLQDVAPNSLGAGLMFRDNRWQAQLHYQYRYTKTDVAASERPTDSAQMLSGEVSLTIGANSTLSFWGRNLLDDSYWISTDDLSTRSEERAFGVTYSWHR